MSKSILSIKKSELLTFFLLASYPISIILGNVFINLYFLFFSISFLINFKKNKYFINNKVNYLLIIFFLCLMVNVLFSLNWLNSLPRVIKIIFIFCFFVEIQRFINSNKKEHINLIFKIWSIIFTIICGDIFYEILFGYNILGYTSFMPGRIASFFGEELVVGAFFHGFVMYFIAFIFVNYPHKKISIIFIILFLLIISFMIGERSNFLKIFFCLFLFSSIIYRITFFKNLLFLTLICITIATFLNFNYEYKLRYYDQLKKILQKDGINYFLNNTQYGAHQIVAYKIFKNYPFFGVGIKNFRSESSKEIYNNKENKYNAWRQATHPHQIHLEFLSETGIFGYLSFLFFMVSMLIIAFKKYLESKSLYLLASILFSISTLIPILPSGSFLSTFSSSIFWANFAIMGAYILNKSKS